MSENKGDLISRSALRKEIKGFIYEIVGLRASINLIASVVKDYMDFVLKKIDEAPATGAKPVVHGEWINFRDYHEGMKADCSNCLETTIMDGGIPISDYKVCRFCGAKMDLED